MPFSEACIGRRACSRSSARCSASPGPATSARRARIDWLALYAQDEAGYRNLCALVSAAHLDRPVEEEPHVPFDALDGRDRRPDRADRGRGGRAGPAVRRGPGRQGRRLCRPAEGAVPRPALYRAQPARRSGRGGRGGRADRPRLCARPAAGRDQPGRLCRARFPRRARRDAVHRPVEPDRPRRPQAAPRPRPGSSRPRRCAQLFADLPEAIDNTAVIARRCAFGAPAAQADPAAHRRRSRRRGRAASRATPRAGLEERLAVYAGSRRGRAPGLSRPARFRDRRHHRHGLSRLFPDRRRLHQMGQGAATSRSARAAARARARWSPGR